MLKAYRNEKNRILKRYKKLLALPNIFPENITKEDIKEKKKQLQEEHFFVSFTGQIKAGKSTLINALLFGEEIIPADDTPHTAKITIIKYGDRPRLEATFYNKEEWKTLQSNQEFYEEFLKPDIEKSITNGLFVEEFIHSTAKVQKEEGLENLTEYVARDGKYTPFVNVVKLYYPNEILKEITIVDTPGTNDPNKLRDKVAKEWIHKTNANIYITYANQAMDRVDIDFIDNFLLSVPKEQKLTVINKIDSVNDTDGLEEYIGELLADEGLKRREIVSNKESLILVSGLGALIDKMLTKELPLSEDLSYYAQQLDEKGFLEPENHKLSTLEKMIEQKLIENKGKNILESHSLFLDSIFKKRVAELEKRLEVKRSSLSDLFKTNEELKESRESLNNILKFIAEERHNIDRNFDHLAKENLEIFHTLSIEQTKISIANTKKELEMITNTSIYKNEVLWIVKNRLDNNFEELKESFKNIIDALTIQIQKEMDTLKYKLIEKDKDISINLTFQTFFIYTLELISGIKELAEKEFKKENINETVNENTNIFQRTFNTTGGLEKINSDIMSRIKIFFDKNSSNMEEEFKSMLKQHIHHNILEKIIDELNKIMYTKKEELNSFLENEKDKETLIDTIKIEKNSLEEKLEEIKSYQKNYFSSTSI